MLYSIYSFASKRILSLCAVILYAFRLTIEDFALSKGVIPLNNENDFRADIKYENRKIADSFCTDFLSICANRLDINAFELPEHLNKLIYPSDLQQWYLVYHTKQTCKFDVSL